MRNTLSHAEPLLRRRRRDSKLTRVLQGSLSGAGARIAVVACVTPASSQAEETHNTLKFATRAKKVRGQPHWFANNPVLVSA